MTLKQAKAGETKAGDLKETEATEIVISSVALKRVGDTFQGSKTFLNNIKMDIGLSMKGAKLIMDVKLDNPSGTEKDKFVLQIRESRSGELHAVDLHDEWKFERTPGMSPEVRHMIREDPYYIFNGYSPGGGLLNNSELAGWIKDHLKKMPEPLG